MLWEVLSRASAFEAEAHKILAIHENSKSRLVVLEDSFRALRGLSLTQEGLFTEALKAASLGLYRAAHVLAWAAFVDFLQQKAGDDGYVRLRQARPKWAFKGVEDLREQFPDYQLIDALADAGMFNKTEKKAVHGLLNKRNESAHPGGYIPTLNETLGYFSEIFQRIRTLQQKSWP